QAEDGIRDGHVTGVQTCALPISKTMSNTDTGFSTFNFGSENKFNQKSEWSIAGNDQTHILNISGVYELPIGPGKKFLNKGGQLEIGRASCRERVWMSVD